MHVFFLKLHSKKKVVYGATISFLGMGLVSYNELVSIHLHPDYIIGFLISLVATLSASAGNLISYKSRQNNVSILSNNAWGMLYGSLMSLIYCLLMQKSFNLKIDLAFSLSFIYLTLFGTVISFAAYLKLIDLVGPSKAAFTSVISPVIAVVVSSFFENMQLNLYFMIGILFCLTGNVVALVPKEWLLKIKKIYAY